MIALWESRGKRCRQAEGWEAGSCFRVDRLTTTSDQGDAGKLPR